MKKTMKKLFYFMVIAVSITACKKDRGRVETNDPSKEYKYLRMIVSDEKTNEISYLNLHDDTKTSFVAKFPKSAVYNSASGRFAAIAHTDNNLAETFDSGLEFHGDHVDTKGVPKFGLMVSESFKPTHFKAKNNELLFFNDGDATLSYGLESRIHTQAKMTTINAGLIAHHGAMAQFSNGTYAITLKDNSVSGLLPERVIIIDKTGKEIHKSTVATTGIHGNATDGNNAVFGSISGILVVSSTGTQRLIPHPNDFGRAWFGTILETSVRNKFIGFTAAKGAYLIDISTNTISPLMESADIMQLKTSYDLSKVGVLLHSGLMKIIDLKTNKTEFEQNITVTTEKSSTQKPQMVMSNRFIYLTLPKSGEIQKTRITQPNTVTKIKVSASPFRLAIMGYESNESH
jgi:hypothetical protein